jgi:hypothetical protein
MAKVCGWCGAIEVDAPGPASHGICPICRIAWVLAFRPALMKPVADRYHDCPGCQYRDLDREGVPDGCRAQRCIRADRRDPWGRR